MKRLGLFALSGAPDPVRVERGLARLRDFGVTVIAPVPTTPRRYLAGDDHERLDHFQALLARNDCDAYMAVRGGFGVTRLLDAMDWERLCRNRKPIIGYSDLCALHLAALQHGCRGHIHGPMLCSEFGRDLSAPEQNQSLGLVWSSLTDCLNGREELLPAWSKTGVKVLKPGSARGRLLPTNLSLLNSLLGTVHFPNQVEGPILVLEDIGEAAYRIDRYLTQLRSAGFLQRLRGLLFGQFSEADDGEYIPDILREVAAEVHGPVACGLPFGHVFPSISLPVGCDAVLTLDETTGIQLRREQVDAPAAAERTRA